MYVGPGCPRYAVIHRWTFVSRNVQGEQWFPYRPVTFGVAHSAETSRHDRSELETTRHGRQERDGNETVRWRSVTDRPAALASRQTRRNDSGAARRQTVPQPCRGTAASAG
ncbi:hypothetical protein C446_11040 [Halobiforma nitratireducens JCM 10879]|uniref:Uncharacterized protein n=1 Tax=Halobiforma nitratireducens JCM 10879 TaxID=1227454 RepID=M0LUI6_9EURY|nr:hypothetical protein C446_11040 [Halobiforma nitratireducens JCM 10879]